MVRLTDRTVSTCLFSATTASIRRVTRSSIRSASMPGQGVITSAVTTGMSGSFRWGILKYPMIPQRIVPTSATQATWRCSVK